MLSSLKYLCDNHLDKCGRWVGFQVLLSRMVVITTASPDWNRNPNVESAGFMQRTRNFESYFQCLLLTYALTGTPAADAASRA